MSLPPALKTTDPLATPIAALATVPTLSVRRESTQLELPSYASLMNEASRPPVEDIRPVEYEDAISPVYPPPPQQQQVQQEIVQEEKSEKKKKKKTHYPSIDVAEPKKPSAFSLDANKNLIILGVIVALVLKLGAPKLRTIARFNSPVGIGLNVAGVLAISIIITVSYKAVTFAAGLSA